MDFREISYLLFGPIVEFLSKPQLFYSAIAIIWVSRVYFKDNRALQKRLRITGVVFLLIACGPILEWIAWFVTDKGARWFIARGIGSFSSREDLFDNLRSFILTIHAMQGYAVLLVIWVAFTVRLPPKAEEREARSSLKRARPLSDPMILAVICVGIFIPWGMLRQMVNSVASYLKMIQEKSPSIINAKSFDELCNDIERIVDPFILVVSILAFIILPVIFLLGAVALWSLFGSPDQDRVLFLRAFRADRSNDRILGLIRAALGGEIRLSGIRPPQQRSSLMLRIIGNNISGLRYIGSPYFELEAASRNWLARLLATATLSRFAIVDLRSLTDNVHDEITMLTRCFGFKRMLFLTSQNCSEPEWRQIIESSSNVSAAEARLLCVGAVGNNEAQFVENLRTELALIPKGINGISLSALEFAQNKVEAKNWNTRWIETTLGQQVVAATLFFMAFLLPLPKVALVMLCFSIFIVYVSAYAGFLFRIRKQRKIEVVYCKTSGFSSFKWWLCFGLGVTHLLFIGLFAAAALSLFFRR